MRYVPKPHQQVADKFLQTHDRGALFLDMGLGKTVAALTHVERLLYKEFSVSKVLVIAPLRVAEDTWSRECEKWDHLKHLRVSKVLGSVATRKAALNKDADIYVINRENIVWLVEYLTGSWPFEAVIIDELSSFKSPSAKRFRALRRVIKLSDYVYGLTGTPAPNGYLDLWAEIFLIDGGQRLGKTITSYRGQYFQAGARRGHIVYEWKLKTGAKRAIDKALSDICLSMSKEDWLKMPPLTYNEVLVRMSKDERKLYDLFKQERVLPLLEGAVGTMDDMDSAVVGTTAATVSNKLLQMANGCVYDDEGSVFHLHDRKLDAMEDIVEAANGQPILCFYSYKHDLSRLLGRFPQATKLETSQNISDWNAGNIPVLLCHPASAGHGLNLQDGGHTIVWFGLPWSLELYSQANCRLHRQGQAQPVIVHHIVCEETLDRKVLAALQSKNATQRSLLDALKGYIQGGNA